MPIKRRIWLYGPLMARITGKDDSKGSKNFSNCYNGPSRQKER